MNTRFNRTMGLCLALLAAVVGLFAPPSLAAAVASHVGPAAALLVMGATTTTDDLDEAMKILFEESVVNNVVTDSDTMDIFEEDNDVKTDETTGGRYIETAQYFQLPSGVGARAENEYIPVPEAGLVANSRIYLKKIQGVVEMTGDTMRRIKGNPGAYLNWAERALPDLVQRLRNDLDRMALGFGSGAKARVNDAAPDGTLHIDSMFGIDGYTRAWLNFLEGERIVFSVAADGDPLRNAGASQSAKVTAIDDDDDDPMITLDALPNEVVDNDYIFSGDASGASCPTAAGVDRETMGLLGMVDDGSILATFQNLLRSSYRLWNSVIVDANSGTFDGELTEELLDYSAEQAMTRGGGEINLILTSHSGVRSYWAGLNQYKTINDPRSFTGGKGKVYILLGTRRIELRAGRKVPPQVTFMLDKSTFKRWQLKGARFEWDDTTGAIWNRVSDGTGRKDAYYAVGNMYKQLGCLAPRKNVRIENLTVN